MHGQNHIKSILMSSVGPFFSHVNDARSHGPHFLFYFHEFVVVNNIASVKHKQQFLAPLYALAKYSSFRYGS